MKVNNPLLILGGCLITAVVLAGCGTTQPPASNQTPAPTQTSATTQTSAADQAGAKLYVDYGCVQCHGVRGVGGVNRTTDGKPSGAPALNNGLTASVVTQYLGQGPISQHIVSPKDSKGVLVADGTINMPYYVGVLNSDKVKNLATYITDKLPAISGYSGQPLPATTGPEIYASYACEQCHGDFNVGGHPNQYAPSKDDQIVPVLGPKADWAPKWSDNTYRKVSANFKEEYPSITSATMTGQQMVQARIMEGSVIGSTTGGAPNTLLMPALGQLMSTQQMTTLLNYLHTGK